MMMQSREDKAKVAPIPDMTRGDEMQENLEGMPQAQIRVFIHSHGRQAENMGTDADKLVDLEVG